MVNLNKCTTLFLFTLFLCASSTLSSADLTTSQQVEMGLAGLRGATGMYNSYTFINNPSQAPRSEIVAKLASIAHDSVNIYNTHGTEHYRLQQSLRLVHDACSLCYVLSASEDAHPSNSQKTGVEEALHAALQALHYALPGIQSGAALFAAIKTSSNTVDNLKAHSITQAAISLCHFINDALKAQNNPNLLYTRLSLCAASLGLLTYELEQYKNLLPHKGPHGLEQKDNDSSLKQSNQIKISTDPINKTPFSQRANSIDQQLLLTPRYFTAIKQLEGTPIQIRFFHLIYPNIQPGSVVGFHHDYKLRLHKQGLYQMKITKKLPVGAYRTRIYTGNKQAISKSFFPPQWDDRMLVDKIAEAVNNPIKQPTWSAATNSWNVTGMTKEGLKIKIAFTNAGVITTAFPE